MNKIWHSLGGRKFVVFLIATILIIFKCISDTTWLWISLIWIGVEGINDIMKTIVGKRQ